VRRRLVWIQAPQEGEGLFLLYDGPDGYYVQKVGSDLQFAAPFFDAENPSGIFNLGLSAIAANDWRFSAVGVRDSGDRNVLFYGPSGLLFSTPTVEQAVQGSTGVFVNSTAWTSSVRQEFWYDHTGQSGSGPNTFPDEPPIFALPNVSIPNPGILYSQNPTLTWAVTFNNIINSNGAGYPITSGVPSPWISTSTFGPGGKEGRVGNLVELTLFVHDLTPDPDIITTTPYHYDPDAGTATAGTPFVTPYAHPGEPYSLRYVSYWTPTP
jgi:hypothetical protein